MVPCRDELRAAILWCARIMVGEGEGPFVGPVRVSVVKVEEGETSTIKPRTIREGLEAPRWFALEEPNEDAGATVSELLRALLSPDEQKLMVDLVTHQPCSATSVMNRCKAVLGTSDFWAVWGQLQKRQLVEQGDDERYRVGPEWLAKWLKRKHLREGNPKDGKQEK